MKKTILVDFDGVIHRYSKGWNDGTAYDEPMDGAMKALELLAMKWEVVIFSTRDATSIREWLVKNGFPLYPVTNVKRPATAIIDDRAIRFLNWEKALEEFQYYYGNDPQ